MPKRAQLSTLPVTLEPTTLSRGVVARIGPKQPFSPTFSAEGDAEPSTPHPRHKKVVGSRVEGSREQLPPQPGTVAWLAQRYTAHAESTYRKRGEPTKTATNAARAWSLLLALGVGDSDLARFGPKRLKAFQKFLCRLVEDDGDTQLLARSTINEYVRHVVWGFQWAASEELVPESVWRALQTVAGLRRGRAPELGVPAPREGTTVRPVTQAQLDAALEELGPVVADMVRLQRITGMRPGELVHIRPCDLVPLPGGAKRYDVPAEVRKLEHLSIERPVFLGPRALEILARWEPEECEGYYFDPRRSEDLRHGAMAENKVNPRWPSHDPVLRRRRKGRPRWSAGSRYTPASYRRAVQRAVAAFNAKHPRAAVEQWFPYQLRHNTATEVLEKERDITVAQVLLGHRDIKTTLRYAQVAERTAAEAAVRLG